MAKYLARLGGDEFAVLAQHKPEQIIQRLQTDIAEYNRHAGRRYSLSLSVGAVQIDLASDDSLEKLIARADAEMYRVKQLRRAAPRN